MRIYFPFSATATHALRAVLCLLSLMLAACDDHSRALPSPTVAPPAPTPPPASSCRSVREQPNPGFPDIDCSAPPNTFDVSRYFATDASAELAALAGPTWDSWAWASFAAMNWPAKQDANQPSGYLRGVPDASRSFATANTNDVLVWETFKEKRELFNTGDVPITVGRTIYPSSVNAESKWQDLTYAERQRVGSPNGVPLCEGQTAIHPKHRIFAQRTKAANYTDFTETDETIEVASQPCESSAQLCAGLPATGISGSVPSYQDCVDNIFPGMVQDVCEGEFIDQRTPVGPRVWNGDPGTDEAARPLYFEVKVNYDFWAYILENNFQLDQNADAAAISPQRSEHPKLPFRTSSGQGPGRSANAVFNYDAGRTVNAYSSLADPNTLPGIGSVQLKAAWLVLTADEDASHSYHTASGYYFKSETIPGGSQTCAQPAIFGLLGLHIIQRVHALEPVNRESGFAYGGTFVFATWEHVGLGEHNQETDYYYANYLAFPDNFYLQGGPVPPVSGPTRPFDFDTNSVPFPYWKAEDQGAIPVIRQQPYPLKTTTAVNRAAHAAIKKADPNSVWLNYRLIGTQFFAADLEPVDANGRQPSEARYNQPYYLTNLVVETNTDLQNFHGLPPGVTVTPYYTNKVGGLPTGTTLAFQRADHNLVFNRQNIGPRNMGGCMGCHGVAQLTGFNFSFVFKGGQLGSGLDTQEDFAVAGGAN